MARLMGRHRKDMRVLRELMLGRIDHMDRQQQARSEAVTDYEMASAMRVLGGSFFEALAEAWFKADEINRAKIVATWSADVEEFRELARLKRARG